MRVVSSGGWGERPGGEERQRCDGGHREGKGVRKRQGEFIKKWLGEGGVCFGSSFRVRVLFFHPFPLGIPSATESAKREGEREWRKNHGKGGEWNRDSSGFTGRFALKPKNP